MICPICRSGKTQPGHATFTYASDEKVVVVKHVPADVCQQCGEAYYDEDTTGRVLAMVREALDSGLELAVREFEAPVAA